MTGYWEKSGQTNERTDGRTNMGQSIGPTSKVGGSKNDDGKRISFWTKYFDYHCRHPQWQTVTVTSRLSVFFPSSFFWNNVLDILSRWLKILNSANFLHWNSENSKWRRIVYTEWPCQSQSKHEKSKFHSAVSLFSWVPHTHSIALINSIHTNNRYKASALST